MKVWLKQLAVTRIFAVSAQVRHLTSRDINQISPEHRHYLCNSNISYVLTTLYRPSLYLGWLLGQDGDLSDSEP